MKYNRVVFLLRCKGLPAKFSPLRDSIMKRTTILLAVTATMLNSAWGAGLQNQSGIPAKDIEAWVTQWENPRSNRKYTFSASFGRARVTGRELEKYKKSGKVPFRVTGDLLELKESRGRVLRKRQTGTAKIVILDVDGKKIISQSISLAKLCPS